MWVLIRCVEMMPADPDRFDVSIAEFIAVAEYVRSQKQQPGKSPATAASTGSRSSRGARGTSSASSKSEAQYTGASHDKAYSELNKEMQRF